jgi:hypothetical protein
MRNEIEVELRSLGNIKLSLARYKKAALMECHDRDGDYAGLWLRKDEMIELSAAISEIIEEME